MVLIDRTAQRSHHGSPPRRQHAVHRISGFRCRTIRDGNRPMDGHMDHRELVAE